MVYLDDVVDACEPEGDPRDMRGSWEIPGLRATLAVRALVLSDRWEPAWQSYAASHRKDIRLVA